MMGRWPRATRSCARRGGSRRRSAARRIAAGAPNPRGRAAGVERLDGRRLERVEAHGKHLLLDFGDLVLHSHLGMSGGWHVYPRGGALAPAARLGLGGARRGASSEAVQFGGPTLRVLAAARRGATRSWPGSAPTSSPPDFDPAAVAPHPRADRAASLGDALLDQTLLAGIGNIFKSEACFAARIDPWRPVGELADGELGAVLEPPASRCSTRSSAAGATASRSTAAAAPARAAAAAVRSRGQGDANRTTYWCPSCQG